MLECTRDPLSTFLSHASMSNASVHRIIAHSVLLSFELDDVVFEVYDTAPKTDAC